MTIACKLWLLAVVCIALLYQDGPQGNGVLCVKNAKNVVKDNSSGDITSEENNSGSDSQSSDSSSGVESDGSDVGDNSEDSNKDDDDDNDDDEYDIKSKKKNKTNKKSKKSKNRHDHDDEDDEDNEDEEDKEDREDGEDEDAEDSYDEEDEKNKRLHKNIKHKINNNNRIGKLQISTMTTITGKPKDVLKYLNADIKPYKLAALDFTKKSNSELLKKINSVTKTSKSSKGKKDPNDDDLKNFMSQILKQSSKTKNNKQVDSDKILISLLKTALLHLINDI